MFNPKPFEQILCRDRDIDPWIPDMFANYIPKAEHPYMCFRSTWKFCIPYQGNEHLCYTTDSPACEVQFGDMVKYRLHGDKQYIGIVVKVDGTLVTVVPMIEDIVTFIRIDIKDIERKINSKE